MFGLVPQSKTVGHKWIAFKLAGWPSSLPTNSDKDSNEMALKAPHTKPKINIYFKDILV